ncbi:hypothetical protein Angca_000593 [Angiostrongylus cantonensis]|nr:hypothetical protein Angca_000593 [Angiostrongylus cantonensis]
MLLVDVCEVMIQERNFGIQNEYFGSTMRTTREQPPSTGHRIANTTHLSTKPTKPDVRQVEEVRDERKPLCSVFGGPPLEENNDIMLSSSFVEHAVLGFAFAVLSLFVLAFSIVAVVLVTVTNNCWWNCDDEGDPLMEDCNSSYSHFEDCEDGGTETVDTVIGRTPSNAAIV